MEIYKLGEMEKRLADLIWANAPMTSKKLTELCEEAFGWKRTTTYTMLKRLCDRGIFVNDGGTIIILMSKEDFTLAQSQNFINETFDGSLPMFLTLFSKNKAMKKEDIKRLQQLIDSYRGDED
jgi:predicted transcriptional regulator